jgi:hypothetical protein
VRSTLNYPLKLVTVSFDRLSAARSLSSSVALNDSPLKDRPLNQSSEQIAAWEIAGVPRSIQSFISDQRNFIHLRVVLDVFQSSTQPGRWKSNPRLQTLSDFRPRSLLFYPLVITHNQRLSALKIKIFV